ncbi:MAG: DNA repair protein RecN [Clostridiales bacterium]|nr:DNA repair protein RecN [Clostridiales bacterium]
MLLELNIENFIIIDHINVKFDPHLNIITGETGAGKSIIIEAINLALGKKIKNAAQKIKGEKANIELIFDADTNNLDLTMIDENIINDGLFVISREIYSNGKSISRLNGKIVSQNLLSLITNQLIDIHGQHMHQSLFDEKNHLKSIDAFGRKKLMNALAAVKNISDEYFNLINRINELKNEDSIYDIDYLEFQYNEITNTDIDLEIDGEIENKYTRLSHLEDIIQSLEESVNLIDEEGGIENLLSTVKNSLLKTSKVDSNLENITDRIDSLIIELNDINSDLNHLLSEYDFDEKEYQFVEKRFNELNLLMKKYGHSLNEILEYKNDLKHKIEMIKGKETILKELNGKLDLVYKQYLEKATILSDLRKSIFKVFKKNITNEIQGLNLKDIVFEANFNVKKQNSVIKVAENGFDEIQFLISTNKGILPMPLKEVASGGEISRIMLGLKIVLSEVDSIDSMIFDEIDSGISGETAYKVGLKMVELSQKKQIIAITHLPQIAAAADRHFKIEKLEGLSQLIPLEEKNRIEEVARILSGSVIDRQAIENSKSLISQIKNI